MNSAPIRVLVAEDKQSRPSAVKEWLSSRGCQLHVASTFEEVASFLAKEDYDLVLCQYALPDRTAFPLLDWLSGSCSTLVFSAKPARRLRWLPVIEQGERRLDRPPVSDAELVSALESHFQTPPEQDGRGQHRHAVRSQGHSGPA